MKVMSDNLSVGPDFISDIKLHLMKVCNALEQANGFCIFLLFFNFVNKCHCSATIKLAEPVENLHASPNVRPTR